MSAGSGETFSQALRAHAQMTARAAALGQPPADPAGLAAASGLIAAAQAHVSDSRPLEEIAAEYSAVTFGGSGTGPAAEALAWELNSVRMATAILAGSYPGTGVAVSTGAGA